MTFRNVLSILLTLVALGFLVAALRVAEAAEQMANDAHRVAEATVQSAHHLDACANRITADAEAACEHLSALPEEAGATLQKATTGAAAPALSLLDRLPFAKPRPSPTPSHP